MMPHIRGEYGEEVAMRSSPLLYLHGDEASPGTARITGKKEEESPVAMVTHRYTMIGCCHGSSLDWGVFGGVGRVCVFGGEEGI